MSARNASSTSVSPRILIVDDNRNGLAARKSVLEELGHKIETATSGPEALEAFRTGRFDVVITDYKMPKMDGLELIAKLRKQRPDLPIILISGFADTLGLNEESTGADVVIQKSASEVSHLLRAVNRLLRNGSPVKKPMKAQSALHVKRKTV